MLTSLPAGRTSIVLDRRKFMAAAAGLIAAGVLPKSALALAGPHTFKHGNFDLTVVSDGNFALPVGVITPDAKPEEIKQILGLAADAETNPVDLSPLLAKSGNDLILFDTGTGPSMGKTSGMIAESLKAAGTDPSAITKVVYTHAHPDHLWGTLDGEGKPVFANASYHIAEAEWNFWTTEMPKDMEGMVKIIRDQLTAIKDKIVPFKPGTELVSGINILDTAGHTAGHASFEFAGGDGLVLVGDAITVPKVFFAHPEWKFGFDSDGDLAGKNRRKLLDMAASGKKQLLGYHWAYPGLGMAEAKDGAFVYVPSV